MRGEKLNVFLVFLASSVLLLWTVLPYWGMIKPFPLSDQVIDSRTYVWLLTIYVAFLIFSAVLYRQAIKTKLFFEVAFILQALQFVELIANYNETWFNIGFYPITVATIRFPVLFIFAIITFLRWNK